MKSFSGRRGRYNAAGRISALTVVTPIRVGHQRALRALLEQIASECSPFARIARIHFARWVVVEGREPVLASTPSAAVGAETADLFFLCTFDGTIGLLLADLVERLPREADAVWGHCAGYPGRADRAAFAGWIRRHEVDTSHFVAGYDATVDEVRAGLALRARLAAFAVSADHASADALRAGFFDAFPEARPPAGGPDRPVRNP